MITYSYHIKQLSTQTVDGIENVVTHIHLDYIGTDENGNSAHCQATIPFDIKDVTVDQPATKTQTVYKAHFNPNDYTPFDNLSQEQVESWIDEHLPETAVATFREIITEKLSRANEIVASYLPWNKP